ncbi:hypothetical protein A2U01_0025035 [Trifolium medium]|uniref:Uncharacterized protein n=1 Tax=Trifolium medium TaxID=97028 RepID=A0A392NVZ9_9FABA|nr:hypothetical protein [Trifolium medium]
MSPASSITRGIRSRSVSKGNTTIETASAAPIRVEGFVSFCFFFLHVASFSLRVLFLQVLFRRVLFRPILFIRVDVLSFGIMVFCVPSCAKWKRFGGQGFGHVPSSGIKVSN